MRPVLHVLCVPYYMSCASCITCPVRPVLHVLYVLYYVSCASRITCHVRPVLHVLCVPYYMSCASRITCPVLPVLHVLCVPYYMSCASSITCPVRLVLYAERNLSSTSLYSIGATNRISIRNVAKIVFKCSGIMHPRCCRPAAGNIVGALYHKL